MITNIILFTIITLSIFYCWIDAMRDKSTTTRTYKRDKKTGRFIRSFKSVSDMREDIGLPKYNRI